MIVAGLPPGGGPPHQANTHNDIACGLAAGTLHHSHPPPPYHLNYLASSSPVPSRSPRPHLTLPICFLYHSRPLLIHNVCMVTYRTSLLGQLAGCQSMIVEGSLTDRYVRQSIPRFYTCMISNSYRQLLCMLRPALVKLPSILKATCTRCQE